MSKPSRPAPIHSLAEAYLYAWVTPCAACAGALDADEARFGCDPGACILTLETPCRQCEAWLERSFDAGGVAKSEFALLAGRRLAPPWEAAGPVLNPTAEASHVIDVAGWLSLFTLVNEQARLAGEQARTVAERSAVRRIRLVAAACLEEALKFFDEDNDLPPDEAFFIEANRRQFWERPQLFTRQYIADLRFSLAKAATEK